MAKKKSHKIIKNNLSSKRVQIQEHALSITLIGLILLVFDFAYETIVLGGASLGSFLYVKLFAVMNIYCGLFIFLSIKEPNALKKSLAYLSTYKSYFNVIIILFFVSAVFGFLFASQLTFLNEILRSLIEQTRTLDPIALTVYIFLNNSFTSFFGALGGIIFGIFPLFTTFGNGLVLGFVLNKAGLWEFWRLIPHGIFELPAVFISLGLGLKLGLSFILPNQRESFKERIYNASLVFMFIVVPLLGVAAVIEGILIFFTS